MSAYLNNGLMSVKKELTSGVMYTAIAKYSGMAIQLVITAILARILAPEDYGIIAIAYVFINFFNILSDIGIGPAIIQNKTLNDNDLKNIFHLLFIWDLFFLASSFSVHGLLLIIITKTFYYQYAKVCAY